MRSARARPSSYPARRSGSDRPASCSSARASWRVPPHGGPAARRLARRTSVAASAAGSAGTRSVSSARRRAASHLRAGRNRDRGTGPPDAGAAPGRCVSSGGCRGRASFVPPNRFRSRPFWSAGARADAAILGQVVDVHGEQNGAIYQEVTLGRSDIAPISLLAEDRADVLERFINGKHGDHTSHLHPRHTARDARPGQGLWSSPWAYLKNEAATQRRPGECWARDDASHAGCLAIVPASMVCWRSCRLAIVRGVAVLPRCTVCRASSSGRGGSDRLGLDQRP